MKSQNMIIVVVAVLVIAGIAIGVYFATKNDSGSTPREIAYNNDPLRSGSLLDRLRAEQDAGMYSKKKETAESGEA